MFGSNSVTRSLVYIHERVHRVVTGQCTRAESKVAQWYVLLLFSRCAYVGWTSSQEKLSITKTFPSFLHVVSRS